MVAKKKLFESRITISAEDQPYSFESYAQLAHDVIRGDVSGKVVSEESRSVTLTEFERVCAEHGTDPDFSKPWR